MEIGGYELRTDTGNVFVTDNFFSLLGKPGITGKPLSVRRFEMVLKGIREKNPCDRVKDARSEIDFALAREEEAGTLQRMRESGELPLRVTHHLTLIHT